MTIGLYDRYLRDMEPLVWTKDQSEVDVPPKVEREVYVLPLAGMNIRFRPACRARQLHISLDCNDDYLLVFRRDRDPLASTMVQAYDRSRSGMYAYLVDIPPRAHDAGFNVLSVIPTQGDGWFAFGHVIPME
jgi:hypothetical protein